MVPSAPLVGYRAATLDPIYLQDVGPKDDIVNNVFFIFNILRWLTSVCCTHKDTHLGIATIAKYNSENLLGGLECVHCKMHLHVIFLSREHCFGGMSLGEGADGVAPVSDSQKQAGCMSCGQAAFFWSREAVNSVWERRQQQVVPYTIFAVIASST